jgi:hypothetical protein
VNKQICETINKYTYVYIDMNLYAQHNRVCPTSSAWSHHWKLFSWWYIAARLKEKKHNATAQSGSHPVNRAIFVNDSNWSAWMSVRISRARPLIAGCPLARYGSLFNWILFLLMQQISEDFNRYTPSETSVSLRHHQIGDVYRYIIIRKLLYSISNTWH